MASSASVSCSAGAGSAVTVAYSSSSSWNSSGAILTQTALPSQRSQSTTTRMPLLATRPRSARDVGCRVNVDWGPIMPQRWVGSLPDTFFDLVAEVAVDVAPVVEGALQHRLADTGAKVANDVVHQAFPLGLVHHVTDQGAGLAPVVVVGAQRVGAAHHVTVGVPTRGLPESGDVGLRAAFGVGRVHRVGRQLVAHCPGGAVAVHR